jgi:hypothetical protein
MTYDEHAHPPGGDAPPTAYAKRGTLSLREIGSEAALRAAVDAFLSELTHSLRKQGCKLIGHIKGVFEAGENGQLFLSVTSFDEKARYKGKLTGSFETIDFALNVIVYGVEREKIEPLVLEGLRRHLGDVARDRR